MIQLLLRIFLAIVTLRILIGLVRFAARLTSRGQGARLDPGHGRGPGSSRVPGTPTHRVPKPIVDRASAIDVPFTEERPEP
ncbi:MAG TPA: hypothetical protein VGJ98_09020 [Candidatus Eisenbacteria bacterium]|jgi:hypothetical protein